MNNLARGLESRISGRAAHGEESNCNHPQRHKLPGACEGPLLGSESHTRYMQRSGEDEISSELRFK